MPNIEDFAKIVGESSSGVMEVKKLLQLSEVYGYRDWLVFDATIIRGLAYYTGVVFEGFDREVLVYAKLHYTDLM
jgi:histidyl-tRNA synthetase